MQIRNHRWLLFGLFLAGAVGVALMVLAWLPRPGINKQNFDRIAVGMTRAEVEAIFGGPPNANFDPEWKEQAWVTSDGDYALVVFDDKWRVMRTDWSIWDPRSYIQKIIDWLLGRPHPREGQLPDF